ERAAGAGDAVQPAVLEVRTGDGDDGEAAIGAPVADVDAADLGAGVGRELQPGHRARGEVEVPDLLRALRVTDLAAAGDHPRVTVHGDVVRHVRALGALRRRDGRDQCATAV